MTDDTALAMTRMKFDVIVGNPPYQGSTNSKSGKNWQPIWPKFLAKVFEVVAPNGFVSFITPRTWASGSRNPTKVYFKEKRIVYLNMNVTKYFNIVGDVSAYILQNCPADNTPTTIIDIEGNPLDVNLNVLNYIPFNITKLGLSIFQKAVLNTEHFVFVESKKVIAASVGPRIIFLAGRNGAYKGRLFVESINKGTTGIGQMAKLRAPFTAKDAAILEQNLKLKVYSFLFNLLGGNRGLNRTWILNALPKIAFDKTMSDIDLYKRFGLTKEEIAYVEANVK